MNTSQNRKLNTIFNEDFKIHNALKEALKTFFAELKYNELLSGIKIQRCISKAKSQKPESNKLGICQTKIINLAIFFYEAKLLS